MTIKRILVPVGDGVIDPAALDAAVILTRLDGAEIVVLAIRPDPAAMLALATNELGLGAAQILDGATEASEGEIRHAREVFDKWRSDLGGDGPSSRFVEETGAEPAIIGRHGRLCDLVVTGGPQDGPRSRLTLEAAMFETGRGVLMAPGVLPAGFPGRILIAWDGSREASRAVAAALPLLHRAQAVHIFTRQQHGGLPAAPEDLAAYLALHGIAATTESDAGREGSCRQAVFAAAARSAAGLVVMGGYSRSRWQEMLFGGMTESVLSHAALPVLLAH
jgi:nucleotide-binding universal stress UspA family protein